MNDWFNNYKKKKGGTGLSSYCIMSQEKIKVFEFKKFITHEKSLVKNNNAEVVGYLVEEPKFNHENLGVKYYIAKLRTPFESRENVKENIVPVLLTESDLETTAFIPNEVYLARGRWSSVRHPDGTFSEFLFTKKVMQIPTEEAKMRNFVQLDGYVRRVPEIVESYNKYTGEVGIQAETFLTIPRPAGKDDEGNDKVKTDTVPVAFRGSSLGAASKLRKYERISLKGYIEECVDKDGNVIKHVVVPTHVIILIERTKRRPQVEVEIPVEVVETTEE